MSVFDWFKVKLMGGGRGVIHDEKDDEKDGGNIVAHRASRASRDYVCETCNADILKGKQYARITRRIEGQLCTEKHCLTCRPPAPRVL
jgi:hypothetical protein